MIIDYSSWIGFYRKFIIRFLRKLIPECFCNIMLVIMLHFRRPWPRMLNSSSWILWSRRANYCSTYIHQEITFKSANRSTHATKQGNIQMFHEWTARETCPFIGPVYFAIKVTYGYRLKFMILNENMNFRLHTKPTLLKSFFDRIFQFYQKLLGKSHKSQTNRICIWNENSHNKICGT